MPKTEFLVMCFDGGGIRGAFAAAFAARLEALMAEELGREWRIGECVDLFGGTSTGGLVGAALAFHIPAVEIHSLYQTQAASIFLPNRMGCNPAKVLAALFLAAISPFHARQVFQSKYRASGLRRAIADTFSRFNAGEVPRLGEARNRLVLPSVNLTQGQTTVFKTSNWPGLVRDRELLVTEVLLATTAAPTYFPIHGIKDVGATADGGLWANHPGMVCLVEAMQIGRARAENGGLPIALEHVHVISVGTGETAPARSLKSGTDAGGLVAWAPHLVDSMFSVQSQGTDFQLRHLLGNRYSRINFSFPAGERPWSLDDASTVARLGAMGTHRAEAYFDEFRVRYGRRVADAFVPAEPLSSTLS